MRPAESYPEQLGQFIWYLLLPAVPRLAWWVLGLLGFSSLNLLFQRELWPHYPPAGTWFIVLLVAGLGALPWLAACTAGRVHQRVLGWWWRGFWQMVAFGAYLGAVLLSILLAIGFLIWLANNQW